MFLILFESCEGIKHTQTLHVHPACIQTSPFIIAVLLRLLHPKCPLDVPRRREQLLPTMLGTLSSPTRRCCAGALRVRPLCSSSCLVTYFPWAAGVRWRAGENICLCLSFPQQQQHPSEKGSLSFLLLKWSSDIFWHQLESCWLNVLCHGCHSSESES